MSKPWRIFSMAVKENEHFYQEYPYLESKKNTIETYLAW